MTDFVATLDGVPLVSLTLTVPDRGNWRASCELLESDATPTGSVVLTFGGLRLSGTVDESASGQFADRVIVGLVGGAGGWSKPLPVRGYHNDAGVKGRNVAQDAARESGETLGDFEGIDRLGVDYARPAAVATVALDDAAGAVGWYVDYDGVTHIAPRPAPPAVNAGDVTLLDFEPETGRMRLALVDPAAVAIGSVIADERLPEPQVIASLEYRLTADDITCVATAVDASPGVAGLLRAIVRKLTSGKLHGLYRYRVVSVGDDGRLQLQAISAADGLPDLMMVDEWTAAGYHADPELGSECLVQFVAGDRSQPVITSFPGKARPGHKPDVVELSGGTVTVTADAVNLGGPGGPPVARQGDIVEIYWPPMINAVGVVNGLQFTGTLTMPGPSYGTIQTASAKVTSQ